LGNRGSQTPQACRRDVVIRAILRKPYIEGIQGEVRMFNANVKGSADLDNRDPKQIEWIQSYYQVFKDLTVYVKQTFPQGIPWNPKGVSLEEAIKSVEENQPPPPAPHPKAAGGPPPPPPPPGPPPPPLKFDDVPKPAADSSGLGAVFGELNKGEAVTKGLRKVNADQMTHKNPSLRAGATVPTRSDSASSVSSVNRGKSPAPGKKPVQKLEGNKWILVSCADLLMNSFSHDYPGKLRQ
jgi:adenylyl cyclase-associated protein